jgi:ApeA N-terminal domain 1
MESNFSQREWNGEFFLPDQFENRFFGNITFSPEKGVVLTYRITGHDLPSKSELLYGVLDTGEQCTLVGTFSAAHSGFSVKNGLSTRSGKADFHSLVIGKFLGEKELFSEVSFSLLGMQEFFFPEGYKDLVKYSNEPLFVAETDYGHIEVGNNASFSILGKDVTAQIYNRNDQALADLRQAFEEIDGKHENSFFMLKKEISYMITIKVNNACGVLALLEHITDIGNLFAILIYGPVYPELIKLKHRDDDGHPYSSTVYPSMALEKRTADLCRKKRSHFHMTITKSNIDLASAIKKWLAQSNKYTTIVSSLQNETGCRNEHSVHGELVMYATQFESISQAAGVGKTKKYEYPVSQFGTDKIKNSLVQIFSSAGEPNFGKGIGSLRNEIAHVGKPKELLYSLDLGDMVQVSQLLQITILGYVHDAIGIGKEVIEKYQDNLMS